MTLQFDPSAYFQAFQAGQNRDQQSRQSVADSIASIPQAMTNYAQQSRQSQMQQMQMQIDQARAARESQTFQEERTPFSQFTGGVQNQTPQNTLFGNPLNTPVPSYRPGFGQSSSTGNVGIPQQPSKPMFQPSQAQQESPIVTASKNFDWTKLSPRQLALANEGQKMATEMQTSPKMAQAGLQKAQAEPGLIGAQTEEASAKAKEAQAQASFLAQTGGKVGEQKLKLQKQFNDENKDILAELKSAQTADGLIDSSKTNPVAYNALPLKLAKMLTGSSRINIQEIQAMGGSKAILDRAAQAGQQMASGTITNDNYQFMKGLAKVLIDSNKNELRNAGMRAALQYSRVNGHDSSTNYVDIVGEPYGQESFGAGGPSQSSSPAGGMQIGRFKVTVR